MNTDRIAEFAGQIDARAFAKMLGPEYLLCQGIHYPWAVRPATPEEMAIMGRTYTTVATGNEEPTDYAPAPEVRHDEPGEDL